MAERSSTDRSACVANVSDTTGRPAAHATVIFVQRRRSRCWLAPIRCMKCSATARRLTSAPRTSTCGRRSSRGRTLPPAAQVGTSRSVVARAPHGSVRVLRTTTAVPPKVLSVRQDKGEELAVADEYGLDPDADYENVPPCTGEHAWGPWVLSPVFGNREDRFCVRCGTMEMQYLAGGAD